MCRKVEIGAKKIGWMEKEKKGKSLLQLADPIYGQENYNLCGQRIRYGLIITLF